MDMMIVCSSWTLDSINSLSWHILPIPLLNSCIFLFWPPKAVVINTFIDFEQASTLRGYFPITTFMTSIQIPIFFVTMKWHKFILPLNFTKEKCIHNKKIGIERPLKGVVIREYMYAEIIVLRLPMYGEARAQTLDICNCFRKQF